MSVRYTKEVHSYIDLADRMRVDLEGDFPAPTKHSVTCRPPSTRS